MSNGSDLRYTNIEIGQLLTKVRKKKGYSTYRLAIESGVSSSVIVRVESSEREPKINTLLRMFDGLKIKPSDFFKKLD